MDIVNSIVKRCEAKVKVHNVLASKFQSQGDTYNFATQYGYVEAYDEILELIKELKEYEKRNKNQ